jgi:hypothetical protein
MEQMTEQILERLLAGQEHMMAKMMADQNAKQEQIKKELMAGQAEMMADQSANLDQVKREIMDANVKNNQEMLATMEARIKEDIKAACHSMRVWREETLACQQSTEANPETTEACRDGNDRSPEEMESEVERREVPTEEAAVKSSRTMKKRHRGRRMAAGRRGKPMELTRRDCGSRGLLAAACRKVSRRATVAWRKRYVSRKIRTQGSCGPRQKLAAARRG